MVKMKRNLIITAVSAVILFLCFALMVTASYQVYDEPVVIEAPGTSITVDATTDLSGIEVITERQERLDNIPSAHQAEISR